MFSEDTAIKKYIIDDLMLPVFCFVFFLFGTPKVAITISFAW